MHRALRSHKLYVPLITVAVSAGMFLIYYFFYVSSQRNYANDRAFRLLSVVSDQLAQRYDNLRRVFAAALVSPKDAEVYLTEQVPDLKGKISDIKVTPGCPALQNRDGDLKLRLMERPGSFFLGTEFRPAKVEHCSVSGSVDLNADLRERFRNITEEYFDDILIASSSGEVLFQKNVSALRITNLNALLPSKAAPAKADETESKKAPPAPKTGKPSTAFQEASQFSNVIDVKLAGTDYKLYIQPVPLAIQGPEDQNLKPIACGLWRSDRLQSEVVSIPYSVLIWGTLLVLSVFALVWPLLKVAYMSPSERLLRKHVFYLLFSALFVTAILTVVVLNWSYSLRAEEESREQLHALAERIDRNVKAELVRALAFLDALGKNEEFLHARFRAVTASVWTGEEFLVQSKVFETGATPYYPYFDNAFWFDTAGRQQYKVTVQARATPRTPIRDAAYFQDVKNERLLNVNDFAALTDFETWSDTRYRFASLYSPNTGEFFVVLARPYKSPATWNDVSPLLHDLSGQILVTRFLSLIDPVVPSGFGYAIVDHDGIVQFHSSAARNQIEDFFEESRHDAALKALVRNGASDHLVVNYLGKRQEMVVQPIPCLGQPAPSLIVFRDSNHFTTVNVACILVFALLSCLFGLPFLVALAIYVYRRKDYPLAGLWPCAKESSKYVDVMAANACIAAVFFIRLPSMTMNETLVAVLTIAAVAVVFACSRPKWATGKAALLYKAPVLAAILVVTKWHPAALIAGAYIALSFLRISKDPDARAHQSTRVERLYLGAVLSLLTVLVVAPCLGFFKISYDTVNRLALESAQIARRDQLIGRAERVEKQFQDLKAKGHARRRIEESLDRYDEPVYYPKAMTNLPGTEPDVSWLERRIAVASGWFPSNRLGAELRHRATSAAEAHWIAAKDGDNQVLRLRDIPKAVVPNGELLGVYPLWRLPRKAAVLTALLAFLLAGWLRFVIRKVFLTDLEDVPQLKEWTPGEGGRQSMLIIGHPKSGKSARAAALPDVDGLDLAQVVTTGNWVLPPFSRSAVVVDHFEFDIDNPNTSLAKLKLLERLLYVEKKRVILLSAVDPMFYLTASSPEIVTPTGSDHEPPAQILDRWAAVLSLFEKRKVEDITENYFSRSPDDAKKPCRKELVKMVRSECDHTAQLRKIGRAMLEAHCHGAPMSKAQFVEELMDRADSYYRVLWSTCTKGERLALFQLAQDGWANPKNERAIQQLQRRRIIQRDSGFRIMNESFRRFVLTAQAPDEVAKWDREQDHSAWSAVKLGLSTALMMFGAWLLYAQQDVFQLGIGYLAALGTASSAVISLIRNLTGSGAAAKSGS